MNQVEQDALELGWRVAALLSLEERITVWIRPPYLLQRQPRRPEVGGAGVQHWTFSTPATGTTVPYPRGWRS
jgi:hypothetical protein